MPALRRSPERPGDRRRGRLRHPVVLRLPDDFPRDVAAFACDLDRTLIADDAALHPRTLAGACSAVRDAGIPFVIVTGRMFRSAKRYVDELGLDGPSSATRAPSSPTRRGRFLRHVPIPLDDCARGDRRDRRRRAPRQLSTSTTSCTSPRSPRRRARTPTSSTCRSTPSATLLEWLDEPPTKLVVVGERTAMDALEVELKARFDGRLYISKSLPEFLELAAPERHEGRPGAHVRGGAPRRRRSTGIVAFGDGENDVELVALRATAWPSRTRTTGCSRSADFVCPRDVGGRRRAGPRSLPRLGGMIDVRAARSDPEAYRAARRAQGRGGGVRRADAPPTRAGASSRRR